MSRRAIDSFHRDTRSPSPVDSPVCDSVFKGPTSSSLSPVRSYRAVGSFQRDTRSSSPVDSPDSVFRSPKSPFKFGLFSAIKGRWSSGSATPQHKVRFKSDALTVPEQNVDRRLSASLSHTPVRIVVSSSEAEFDGSSRGGGKLRKRREFGSTGDLLGKSAELKSPFSQFLGKSMEQVNCVRVACQ
jgi:hypothetical protein